jgi:hypothetical protein
MSAQGFHATPSNTQANLHASAQWLVLGGGAIVALRLTGALALRLDVEVGVPLARPAFAFVNQSSTPNATVHEPAAAAGKGAIGLEVRFF